MTTLKQVKHEGIHGKAWVMDKPTAYYVMKVGITHSESVAAFDHTEDGLSLAIAYCDYLDKRNMDKLTTQPKGN